MEEVAIVPQYGSTQRHHCATLIQSDLAQLSIDLRS